MTEIDNSNTRILVVDDDPVSRSLMTAILKPEGYTILSASSGHDLLARLEAEQPDVLLLDVIMPGIDGFELCRQIKADAHWQHLPILLVTSLNSDDELVAGLDAGADEFISKPVGAAELRARVRSMRRLKQRADLLLQMSQMREDLANMVVHDLRTPLANCMMRTDMAIKFLSKDRQEQAQMVQRRPGFSLHNLLSVVREQLDNLNSQVDDILIMAKTDQNEIMLDTEMVDLRELVQRTAADFETLVQRDRIELRVVLPELACQRSLDVKLVNRMINNLVSNAVKFSPAESSITLRLLVENSHSPVNGRSLVLEVADEGLGIPHGYREHIFDRYVVASTQSKGVRSIGLGLAFCKMVAEAHDGRISVHDNQPHGTLFRVVLPA